jgi:hypothetical protein
MANKFFVVLWNIRIKTKSFDDPVRVTNEVLSEIQPSKFFVTFSSSNFCSKCLHANRNYIPSMIFLDEFNLLYIVFRFSCAKKCSNEGRALMQLDFQQFLIKLEKLTSLRCYISAVCAV